VKIGVLALQGAFREHLDTLDAIGVEGVRVREPADLDGVSGLILPGGESTTMRQLIERWGLRQPILDLGADHPARGPLQREHGGVVGDEGAVMHRRASRGEHQPRVVALGVVKSRPAPEPALPQHRLGLEHGALAQHAVHPHIPE